MPDDTQSPSWTLYRLFDGRGDLLYIGLTNDMDRRAREHEYTSGWVGDVATAELEHFAVKAEGLRAERNAIRREKPIWNVTNVPPDRRLSREYVEKRGWVGMSGDLFRAFGVPR